MSIAIVENPSDAKLIHQTFAAARIAQIQTKRRIGSSRVCPGRQVCCLFYL
jgi:hypothetical protein